MAMTIVDAAGVFQIFERLYYPQVKDVISPLTAGHFRERDYERVRESVESRVMDFGQARNDYAEKIASGDRLPIGYSEHPPETIIRMIAEKNAELILTAVEESYFDAYNEYEKIARAQARSYRGESISESMRE